MNDININYYPVFLNVKDRLVVVIGGGRVAMRKVSSLVEAGARCRVVSPVIDEGLEGLKANGLIEHIEARFSEGHIEGAWLVIAATDDVEVQDKVFRACEARGIFCNVVDVPQRCSFIVPSVLKRGAFKLAISTSGLGPGLSRAVRLELEGQFPEEFSRYVDCIGRLRRLIIDTIRDEKDRRDRLTKLFDLSMSRYFIKGDIETLRQWALTIGGQRAVSILEACYGKPV